jgi:ubiquinol-cytochrome c reductase cytochrome b subunit
MKFIDWLDERLAVREFVKVMLTEYYVPKNINFLWSSGVLIMLVFAILVVSGIFLLMYYKPDAHLAFDSVNKTIMMDVEYGWLFRHTHAVGASITFLVLFIHMARGIYYGSFKPPREILWITGYLLFVLMSATAFTGYLLPWGQMSYWAAQTITSLFGKIPFIGPDLVIWIRGNYIVEDVTLTRFFALHVVFLPLLLIVFTAIHLYALRIPGSNNEDGEHYTKEEKKHGKGIPFCPVFMAKEFFVMSVFLIFFFYLVFYQYEFAMDPINFQPADYLQTPMHIYPEWYFLAFYEVLRGFFFSQNFGFIAFVLSMIIAAFLPWLDTSPIVSGKHRPIYKVLFWIFIADFVFLTILGKLPPTGLYAWLGFVGSLIYFAFFLALPIVSKIEKKKVAGGR